MPDKDAGNREKKKEDKRKDPKKEPSADKLTWLPLPEKFKNLTPEQSNALSKKCTELNVCKNCADHDKSWPHTRAGSAPSRTDGEESGLTDTKRSPRLVIQRS